MFAILCIVLAPPGLAVDPPRIIASVVIEGNETVDSGVLLNLLRLSKPGKHYNPGVFKVEMASLERFYHEEGFLRVKVGPPRVEALEETAAGRRVTIYLPIREGRPYQLGSLEVQNTQVLSAESLLRISPITTGAPYSRKKVGDWRAKITESYQSMGYLRFSSRIQEKINDLRHLVHLVLICDEGRAYRVGRIAIEGDESIDRQAFRKLLLIGEGLVYDPQMLGITVQLLNRMRVYQPITHRDVIIDINDESSTVDITLRVALAKKPNPSGKS